MIGRKVALDQPFWVDDPNPYALPRPAKGGWSAPASVGLYAISYLARFAVLIVFVLIALKLPWFWLFVLLYGGGLIMRAYFPRRAAALQTQAAQIQQRAKDQTGATRIGSALHTAGHPLLQVNQPVVLALKDAELSIYSYLSSIPIDTLQVNDLESVETVVYDDDRVPHVGVIDNTAQALQLTFPWRGQTCTCQFRRMYNVRAIDWYQVIQTARLLSKAG